MPTPYINLCCFCGQTEPDITITVIPYRSSVTKAGTFTAHEACFASFLDPAALNTWKEPFAQNPH